MVARELIEILRAERCRQKIYQSVLSEDMGFGGNAVWRWEGGHGRPSIDSFIAWANGLGYEVVLKKIGDFRDEPRNNDR